MKYLFLIVVCYAISENVGNNYFVVEMPDDPQQDVKYSGKPFQVYWNVPTMQCASKRIAFQNLYEKFGIIQNDNDQFIGNKIAIIYNEVDFPAIIYNKSSGEYKLRNGGVPQKGNLKKHLIAFENELNKKIPDPYFDGVGIIDFESWRPVFLQNFGSLVPHRHLSIEIEKQLHNWWPKMWIEREASLRFETASRRFMQATLSLAKDLRPNALWGYYGFPHCFNMRGRDMNEKCAKDIDKENDSIYWLWAESTALFPSIYSSVSLSSSQLSSLVKGRVKEASRVRGRDTPIFPYFWFRYRDAGYLTEKDLEVVLSTIYKTNASGFIIWGSSNDVNTLDKCNKLFNYVETVVGPNVAKYTKQINRIRDHLEDGDIDSNETSTEYDDTSYRKNINTHEYSSTEISTDSYIYTTTDDNPQTLNNDEMFSTANNNKYTNTDDTETLGNYNISQTSTNSEYMDNTQSLNNDELHTTETLAYDKYTDSDKNVEIINKSEISSATSSGTSTDKNKYTNVGQSSQIYRDETFLTTHSTIDYSNTDRLLTSNTVNSTRYNVVYNEYFDTEENLKSLNSYDVIFSSQSSTTYDEPSDSGTANDMMSSTDTSTLHNGHYINNGQGKITSNNIKKSPKRTSRNYDELANKDQSTESLHNYKPLRITSSGEINDSNRITGITKTTENNEFEATGADFSNFNIFVNSNEDRSDYLIRVDNYKYKEPSKDSKYTKSAEVDDDYLINLQEFNNQGLKENITYNKLETETDYNFITVPKSDNVSESANYLDLNVTDTDKEIENKTYQDSITTENESSLNINILDSGEDNFDYKLLVDNSKKLKSYNQSEHTNITHANNDYKIIERDFNNEKKEKHHVTDNKLLDLYSTTRIQADFDGYEDLDPIVKYITKPIDDMKLQDLSSREEYPNNKLLNSNEDESDDLIKIDSSFMESDNQYQYTVDTSDNNNLIIVRNINEKPQHLDKNNAGGHIVHKLEGIPSTPQIKADVTKASQNYDFSEMTEELYDEDDMYF